MSGTLHEDPSTFHFCRRHKIVMKALLTTMCSAAVLKTIVTSPSLTETYVDQQY